MPDVQPFQHVIDELERRIVAHQEQIDTYRKTLAILRDPVTTLLLPSHNHANSKPSPRERTALFLNQFDRTTPRELAEARARAQDQTLGRNIGILLKSGYLKRRGDGYIRTGKAFPV